MKKLTLTFIKNKINITKEGFEGGMYDWCHRPHLPSYLIEKKSQIQAIVFKVSPACWMENPPLFYWGGVPQEIQTMLGQAIESLGFGGCRHRVVVYRPMIKVAVLFVLGLMLFLVGGVWMTKAGHSPTPISRQRAVVAMPNLFVGESFSKILTLGVPLEKIVFKRDRVQIQVACTPQSRSAIFASLGQLGLGHVQKREWRDATGREHLSWEGQKLSGWVGHFYGQTFSRELWVRQLEDCVTQADGQMIGKTALSVSLDHSEPVLVFLKKTVPFLNTSMTELWVEVVGTDLKVGWVFDVA